MNKKVKVPASIIIPTIKRITFPPSIAKEFSSASNSNSCNDFFPLNFIHRKINPIIQAISFKIRPATISLLLQNPLRHHPINLLKIRLLFQEKQLLINDFIVSSASGTRLGFENIIRSHCFSESFVD